MIDQVPLAWEERNAYELLATYLSTKLGEHRRLSGRGAARATLGLAPGDLVSKATALSPKGETSTIAKKGRSHMSFSVVPLLLAGKTVSVDVKRALVEHRLQDAAELLMKEYELSCIEASDLLDIAAC